MNVLPSYHGNKSHWCSFSVQSQNGDCMEAVLHSTAPFQSDCGVYRLSLLEIPKPCLSSYVQPTASVLTLFFSLHHL